MATVHTHLGPGEIIAEDVVRGRKSYRVAGEGFDVWLDETKVGNLHQGRAPVDFDNSTALPYNPDPQYPAIPGNTESTIQPIHHIDPDERLRDVDSVTFREREEHHPSPKFAGWQNDPTGASWERAGGDIGSMPGYGGGSPNDYGAGPEEYHEGWKADNPDEHPAESPFFEDLHPSAQQRELDQHNEGAGAFGPQVGRSPVDYEQQEIGGQPYFDEETNRWPFVGSVHEAIGPALMAILPAVGRAVGPAVARGAGGAVIDKVMGGGEGGEEGDGELGDEGNSPEGGGAGGGLKDKAEEALNAMRPGYGWGPLIKPSGLSDKYIDITANADYHHNPILQFRHDPDAYISRVGNVLDETDVANDIHLAQRQYMDLVEADPQIREAAWKDVRQKGVRLRGEGKIAVHDISPSRIYATVEGDTGVYDVMISREGMFGGVHDGYGLRNWRCACLWGQWAWKRKYSYVGRLCSHGYAAFLEMQSANERKRGNYPKRSRKQADALQQIPTRLTPELVINDTDDASYLVDVTKDERRDTGPGDVMGPEGYGKRNQGIEHFSSLMALCDRQGAPYPRELVAYLERLGAPPPVEDPTRQRPTRAPLPGQPGSPADVVGPSDPIPEDQVNRSAPDKYSDNPEGYRRDVADMYGVDVPGGGGGAIGDVATSLTGLPLGGPAPKGGDTTPGAMRGAVPVNAPNAPPAPGPAPAPGEPAANPAPGPSNGPAPGGDNGGDNGGGGAGDAGGGGGWQENDIADPINSRMYTVNEGDTLSDIAQRSGWGENYEDLGKQIGLTDVNKINTGDVYDLGAPKGTEGGNDLRDLANAGGKWGEGKPQGADAATQALTDTNALAQGVQQAPDTTSTAAPAGVPAMAGPAATPEATPAAAPGMDMPNPGGTGSAEAQHPTPGADPALKEVKSSLQRALFVANNDFTASQWWRRADHTDSHTEAEPSTGGNITTEEGDEGVTEADPTDAAGAVPAGGAAAAALDAAALEDDDTATPTTPANPEATTDEEKKAEEEAAAQHAQDPNQVSPGVGQQGGASGGGMGDMGAMMDMAGPMMGAGVDLASGMAPMLTDALGGMGGGADLAGMGSGLASGVGDAVSGLVSGIGGIFGSRMTDGHGNFIEADRSEFGYPSDANHLPFDGSGPLPPLKYTTSEEEMVPVRNQMEDVTKRTDGPSLESMRDKPRSRHGAVGITRAGPGPKKPPVEPEVVRVWAPKVRQGAADMVPDIPDPYSRTASSFREGAAPDDDPEPFHTASASDDFMPEPGVDVVAQFQRSAAAQAVMSENSGQSNDDLANAANAFLQRTAGRNFSMAEQAELMNERHPLGARNLDQLDLGGTHYEAENSVGLFT